MYSSTIKELVEFFETQTVLSLIAAIRLFLLSCCFKLCKERKKIGEKQN